MGRSCLLTARVAGCSREPEPPARMMPLASELFIGLAVMVLFYLSDSKMEGSSDSRVVVGVNG